MTATERFIEDAVEGGWNYPGGIAEEDMEFLRRNPHAIILDPDAWRAVGKTRGWGEVTTLNHDTVQLFDVSRSYMHDLIDSISNGDTIEQYLSSL